MGYFLQGQVLLSTRVSSEEGTRMTVCLTFIWGRFYRAGVWAGRVLMRGLGTAVGGWWRQH